MEVIKQQMAKEEPPPPVAPHAPLHGINQPASLLAAPINNNSVNLHKAPRPTSGILRHPNLAAPS
jgi:hypothetical protein